jgi:cysteine desulfurase family protein (TIGR01976 family)
MPYTEEDCRRCRADFPALSRTLELSGGEPLAFLDGPAGTQVPRAVIDAVVRYYETSNANTCGTFPTGRDCDALLLASREAAAAFLGAPSWREISFGANMTTLTFALSHALAREMKPGDEIVVTALDHEANRGPWLALAERGVAVREVAVTPEGRLDAEDFARQVGHRTRLVAVGAASNALGTVNDLGLARRLARAAGAWLLVDAVHYAPHFPIDVAAWDADFVLCSAYKFYGPHVGILYTRPGLLERLPTERLRTQDEIAPYRIETGTLNHAAIAGVKAAVEYIASHGRGETLRERVVSAVAEVSVHESSLARRYAEEVARIPGVRVWGPPFDPRDEEPRAPTVSITLDGVPAPELARRLGERGVQVWAGDFYAARIVEVLGLASQGGLLRAGFVMYNTAAEVDRLLAGIAEAAQASRSQRPAGGPLASAASAPSAW